MTDLFDYYGLTPEPGAFDPEGKDYDYATALDAGMGPDETGHWSSREPQSGQILKGRGHETFSLTERGERDAGMQITQGADGRYYSAPAQPQGDLFDYYQEQEQIMPLVDKITPQVERPSRTKEETEAGIFDALKDWALGSGKKKGEVEKMWDDLSLQKLAKVGRRAYQQIMHSAGDIAEAEIGQQLYGQNIYADVYNPENKFGRQHLEELRRQAQATIARNRKFIDSLPEEEAEAMESLLGRILEGGFTGSFRFLPTMFAAAGGPGAAYAVATAQIAGQKRAELVKEGKSEKLAWEAASIEALPSAAVETASNLFQLKLAGKVLGRTAKALHLPDRAQQVIKWFLKGGAAEAGEEIAQEEWSLVTDSYVEDPSRSPAEIAKAAWEKIWTLRNLKNVAMAGATGFAGGLIFHAAGHGAAGAARVVDKVRGGSPVEAPEGETEVKGPVEPVPTGEGGLGFALTEETKIVKPGETEAETKTVGEQQKEAAANIVLDDMFEKLTPEEIKVVRERVNPTLQKMIDQRLEPAEKPEGEEAVEEKPVELPKGQGGEIEAMGSMKRANPNFDLAQVQESKTTESQAATHKLGDALNSRITFYKAERGSPADHVNGFYDEKSDRIFINENAAEPDLFVLGHESFHELSVKHPDLWNKAMDVVMAHETTYKTFADSLNKDRVAAGIPELGPEDLRKEFGSDIAGRVFTRPKFWKDLQKAEPKAFATLRDIVTKIIEKIKSALKVGTATTAQVKNMEKVEAAISEAYIEAKRRQGKVVTEAKATIEPESFITRMPRGSTVNVNVIDKKTGETVIEEMDPKAALADLEDRIEKCYQVLECISSAAV